MCLNLSKCLRRIGHITVLNTFISIVKSSPCDNHFDTLPSRKLCLMKKFNFVP